jgi:hypothetical protein
MIVCWPDQLVPGVKKKMHKQAGDCFGHQEKGKYKAIQE